MEIIEYEPINLHDGRFCKVFHSDWIQLHQFTTFINNCPFSE